jgi:hypothetical protein
MVSCHVPHGLYFLTPHRYVLSPTHIHEFKSADRIYTQPPVMSLYLPDQKLGSRSQPGNSSHKFVIKGRQAGSMHRGHTWVFRAETYETMLAWYDDIKNLTEKTGEERNAFVRRHASVRSTSAGSARSASSDGGLEEDEADAVPYSANQSMVNQVVREQPTRPSPGGRFPSDLTLQRSLQAPLSPSSDSSDIGHDLTTAAGGPQQELGPVFVGGTNDYRHNEPVHHQQEYPAASYVNAYPPTQQPYQAPVSHAEQYNATPHTYQGQTSNLNAHEPAPQTYESQAPNPSTYAPDPRNYEVPPSFANPSSIERHESTYGNWMAPAAGGATAGAAAGALATEAYRRKQMEQHERAQQQEIINQAQARDQEQHYPNGHVPTAGFVGAPPAVPERDPDHHAPVAFQDVKDAPSSALHPTLIPAPVMASGAPRDLEHQVPASVEGSSHASTSAIQSTSIPAPVAVAGASREPIASRLDGALNTPSTANTSFLDDSEVGGAVYGSGKTINGGPVPVELVEVAQHPGMHRTNTDISVSDLHVPGEYPRAAAAPKVPAVLKEEPSI